MAQALSTNPSWTPPVIPAPPTIHAVARRAGVSRQTVSNALNAPDRLRRETLARVLHVVDEMGYRPNRSARSLRTRTSRLVGFRVDPAIEGTAGSLLDRFLHTLVESAQQQDHHILAFTPTDAADELSGYDDLLRTTAVDAFVLTGTHRHDERLPWLQRQGAPFVAFGRPWDRRVQHPWVDVDGAAGTRAAVDHLVARGHRRIGYVGWPAGSDVGDDRHGGWLGGVRAHRLPGQDLVLRVADGLDTGRSAAATLLDSAEAPTALVCASDTLAAGCLHELAARGLRPAADVAVIGFDDSPVAELVPPGLTSVRQPLEAVAREVVRMLGEVLTGTAPDPDGVLLTPSLVVRGTT